MFFCVTVQKISVGEPFSVSLCLGTKKVWIRGGWGVSRFSVEIFCFRGLCNDFRISAEKFLSNSAEKLRMGTLYCFTIFAYRKNLDQRRGVGIARFSIEKFGPTVPKKIVGEPFVVSLISVIENDWIRGEGDYQVFPSKIICFTVPKNFVG